MRVLFRIVVISGADDDNVLVNMKSICSPSGHIVYQGTLCTYLSRHAIFNEQSDLDRSDTISHDLVLLVMPLVSSIKIDSINAETRISKIVFRRNQKLLSRVILILGLK